MVDHAKIVALIDNCDNPDKLRTWIANARANGETGVAEAAFRRLIYILPQEKPGTVEHDFWQTMHAFEHTLSVERGKTTRLARTRQKVARVGVIQTLRDWALSNKSTEGFDLLLDRNMPELTGEAIVLRHSDQFSPDVLAAAKGRLKLAGVDTFTLSRTFRA